MIVKTVWILCRGRARNRGTPWRPARSRRLAGCAPARRMQKTPKLNMRTLVRRDLLGWEVRDGGIELFRAHAVAIECYRYRGSHIPTPWASQATGTPAPAA